MDTQLRRLKSFLPHVLVLGFSTFFIIIAITVLWWDVARQPAITDSFSYSADTVTSQTFYDPENERVISTQYLKTNLELDVSKSDDATLLHTTLGNTQFDRQTNFSYPGQPIDSDSGTYIRNGKSTNDYVMAPRGLKKGQTFSYWHPIYQGLVGMDYEDEEMVGGLEVYRFGGDVKETASAGPINPAVTLKNGDMVRYRPSVKLWIEPVSGWIVKHSNEVAARVINEKTNEQKGVYANVHETMTDESVGQHVAYAKTQKLRYVFASQFAPSIILTILFSLVLTVVVTMMKSRIVPIYGAAGLVLTIAGVIFIGWIFSISPLMSFFAQSSGINPLVVLCFVLVALAIIALYQNRRKIVTLAGGVITIFAGLQLLNIMGIVPFSVDLLLFRDEILALDATQPSRMSVYVAFTFFILGIALIKAALSNLKTEIHFARFVTGIVFTIGMIGAVLKITQVDRFLVIDFTDPFSIVPFVLFVICSFTLIQLFRTLRGSTSTLISTLKSMRWSILATVPLVVIAVATQMQRNELNKELSKSFTENIAAFEKALITRTRAYTATLAGAHGLFTASTAVSGPEFRQYLLSLDGLQEGNGLSAIGYAKLSRNLAERSTSGIEQPPVAIFPQSTEQVRAPITYSERIGEVAKPPEGFDLRSDITLRQALDRARDSNQPVLSGNIQGLWLAGDVRPWSLLVTPVYKNNSVITSVEQRRHWRDMCLEWWILLLFSVMRRWDS